MGIHREAGAAHVVGNKEHALPMVAAIAGAVNTFVLLGTSGSPQNTGEDDIGIRRIDNNATDAAAFGQAHVRPRLACVGGFINSISHDVAVADHPGFAGPRPYRAGIGRRDGERADCCGGLLVEYWRPAVTAVDGFPNAARGRACVVRARVAGNSGDGCDTIAYTRANKTKAKLAFVVRIWLLRTYENIA